MYGFYKSWIYRLWVFGGLAVVAGVVVTIGVSHQPGQPPPYATFGAVLGVWLVGILVLQAIGLTRSRPPAAESTGGAADEPTHPPGTATELIQVLALPDAQGRRRQRHATAAGDAYRFAWAQWLPIAAVAILLPLGGFLWVTGAVPQIWQPLGPTGPGIPVAALPGLVIVVILLALLPRTMGRAKRISDDFHAPLGLQITRTPQSVLLPRVGTDGLSHNLVGPTTFAGVRHGRRVVVDAYAGSTAVLVADPGPAYELRGRSEGLEARGAPAPPAVADYVARLTPDRRWNGLTVTSGSAGVRVDRRGSAVDQDWLVDIWLAEHLADLQSGSGPESQSR